MLVYTPGTPAWPQPTPQLTRPARIIVFGSPEQIESDQDNHIMVFTWCGTHQGPSSITRAGILARLCPRAQPAGVEPEPEQVLNKEKRQHSDVTFYRAPPA